MVVSSITSRQRRIVQSADTQSMYRWLSPFLATHRTETMHEICPVLDDDSHSDPYRSSSFVHPVYRRLQSIISGIHATLAVLMPLHRHPIVLGSVYRGRRYAYLPVDKLAGDWGRSAIAIATEDHINTAGAVRRWGATDLDWAQVGCTEGYTTADYCLPSCVFAPETCLLPVLI